MTPQEAADAVASGDPWRILAIDGQFAIIQKREIWCGWPARSGWPMGYFLAKQADGPCLVVAERIEQLHEQLKVEGLADLFDPS